jgi:Spy/CpxP family protein refolding chaperone
MLMLAAADPAPSAAAASPPAAVATATAAAPARKPRPDDQVCWYEKPTGSHLTKEVCATREQAEKAMRDGEDAVSHNDHRGRTGGLRPS